VLGIVLLRVGKSVSSNEEYAGNQTPWDHVVEAMMDVVWK
jgi:hypothetical protein